MVGIKSCPTSSSPSPQLTQMRKMFSDRLRALALADSLFLLFTVLTMGVPRDPIQQTELWLDFWPEKWLEILGVLVLPPFWFYSVSDKSIFNIFLVIFQAITQSKTVLIESEPRICEWYATTVFLYIAPFLYGTLHIWR